MSFGWFKKHEKTFLWVTVIFTVLIFATFSGFDDIRRLMEGDQGVGLAGEFTCATTGERIQVQAAEFFLARRNLARLMPGMSELPDEEIWAHLMLVADAEGAGLRVADEELADMLTGGQPVSRAAYQQHVLHRLQFSSVRAFERAARRVLLERRWRDLLLAEASIVGADEVYKRWSVDNELFDFQAAVFADLAPEDVDDPGDGTLQAWWDELPPFLRERQYAEPPRFDLIYGWLPLDAPFPELPEELLAAVATPDDAAVTARFERVKSLRFPELEALDDETRETLRAELRLVELATAAHRAFNQGESRDKAAFLAAMEAHGLRTADPEGLLGTPELEALEGVGSARLPARLRGAEAGVTRYVPALAADDQVASVYLVEAVEPERPLTFEEAREQVLEAWRSEQVSRPARDFRDRLRAAARAMPEAQEALAPIEAAAAEAAEARIAASEEELDEAARAAIRQEELDAVEPEVMARLAEFEGRVWDDVVAEGAGLELRAYTDVCRNRRREFGDEAPDPESLDAFLRSAWQVFQQDVDGVTDVLRHGASSSSAVVRVGARRFLPEAEMLADAEGMAEAKDSLVRQRRFEMGRDLTAALIVAEHDLLVPKVTDEQASPAEE